MSTNTPRLRSAYPTTPRTNSKSTGYSPGTSSQWSSPAPQVVRAQAPPTPSQADPNAPLVPFTILDAPTQRFYLIVIYVGFFSWRMYDWWKLYMDDAESLWLFMKWVAIDSVFLYGLPGLRVPWLEWSTTTTTFLFLLHAILDAFLMFQIPIPLMAWLAALIRLVYDKELAISENRVNSASLLHNSSLILGKQIIHILPEGSAVLNPDRLPFCIDSSKGTIDLPIHINQTTPISIEILRIDLDTNLNETITISSKELRRLKKQADKAFGKKDTASPRTLKVPVKQTGLYRLQKVTDESNLEVQRRLLETLVVECPSASIKSVSSDKCMGQLSDFFLQVHATPPLKIRYSKTINKEDESDVFLTIHPEGLVSPLARSKDSGALIKLDPGLTDVSWARSQDIEIPVNETLGIGGSWQYSIDEVHDACGNVVTYARNEESGSRSSDKAVHPTQIFIVHERPKARFHRCNSQNPLKAAKNSLVNLPIYRWSIEPHNEDSSQYDISYTFASESRQDDKLGDDAVVQMKTISLRSTGPGPQVSEPGLYSLKSVATKFCEGEIEEPASCLLQNPPEPGVSISSEEISDKCAGNSIGLLVDLDLTGTPPFEIFYKEIHGRETHIRVLKTDRMRTQLELKPSGAGTYEYHFVAIHDHLYGERSITEKDLVLKQDVKPLASAFFMDWNKKRNICNGDSVEFRVYLTGQAPWTLEYEHIHRGKRRKEKIEKINGDEYLIKVKDLTSGGLHSVSLISVVDKSGCKIPLEEEMEIEVRHSKPTAAFGHLEGERKTMILEGSKLSLPLRLTGEAPWNIKYRRLDTPETTKGSILEQRNDVLSVTEHGIYELLEVADGACPGTIEPEANKFEVNWIPRPSLQVAKSTLVTPQGEHFVKAAVCEGDQDVMEIAFTGHPPYQIKYEVRNKPDRGAASVSTRKETSGLDVSSIRMETAKAGQCEYKFFELGDQSYNHDRRKFTPLVVQQTVHSKPSASFANAGKTYSFCKEKEAGDEVVPIDLVGTPPFSLEMGIRHHATAKPEIVTIPNIENRRHDFRIPHHVLALGTHRVSIRKVRDAHGCERATEYDAPIVRVNVVDIPSIFPMEATTDYCVGDRISYTLSGTPPFNVFYTFEGVAKKAAVSTTNFRRIAEKPGNFTVTAVSDKASTDACRARTKISKIIHSMPSVRISKGLTTEVDIHEGGAAEILFEFGGSPPFEFTYTRSTNAAKGKKSTILETKNDVSQGHTKSIRASEEGTYEVVSIRDRYCGFSTQTVQGKSGREKQQLLTFK